MYIVHEFWTISTVHTMHTRMQIHTNMVAGTHEYKHSKLWLLLLLLSFVVFVPASAHPVIILVKSFVQIYLIVSFTSNM